MVDSSNKPLSQKERKDTKKAGDEHLLMRTLVNDCCLITSKQYFSHIMTRASYFLMK